MPRMKDATPIHGSTFVMNLRCECGGQKFRVRGGILNFKCTACNKTFPHEESVDEQHALVLERATWEYDPVPSARTNG